MLGNQRPLETPRWTVLALTLLFTLAAGVVVTSAPAAAAPSGNATGHNQSQSSSSPGAAVSIAANQTTRNEVELTSVTLPENGFIVVQNDTNVSSPSGIVDRTQYVRSGRFEDVVVAINETVTNGTTLRVTIHNDTNGNERFDFVNSSGKEDGPVKGPDGKPISDTVRIGNASNESNASAKAGTNTTPSAQTATSRPNTNGTARSNAPTSPSSSESLSSDVESGSSAQSRTPATTLSTPTPNGTANASVGGGSVGGGPASGPAGGGIGGSGSGAFATGTGDIVSIAGIAGIADIAGLSPSVLLLIGALVVVALVEMAVIARPSFRWLRIPSFPVDFSSVSGILPHGKDGDQPALTAIQQVGDDRASRLREAGFESVEDVATASQSALTDVEGIGDTRAEAIAESANSLFESESSGTVDDAPADVGDETSVLTVQFTPNADDNDDTHIEDGEDGEEDEDSEAGGDGDEEQTGVVANVRTSLAEVARRACGHMRMLFNRRALDPRAYGATTDWTALTFDCSNEDESVREMLEETVYIGEVPFEITGEAPADRPERRLSVESSVRVPREGIEQVEQAAQADNPEAKRTVTLLRRALRAEEEQAIRGSEG
jgi:hypothetical protein